MALDVTNRGKINFVALDLYCNIRLKQFGYNFDAVDVSLVLHLPGVEWFIDNHVQVHLVSTTLSRFSCM